MKLCSFSTLEISFYGIQTYLATIEKSTESRFSSKWVLLKVITSGYIVFLFIFRSPHMFTYNFLCYLSCLGITVLLESVSCISFEKPYRFSLLFSWDSNYKYVRPPHLTPSFSQILFGFLNLCLPVL